MSKAAIFAVNTVTQTLTGTGLVSLGSPVHGFGCVCGQKAIDVSGNNLTLHEAGMYGVVISATVTASATGTVTLQAYQDGTAIGAPQSVEIATADGPASVTVAIGPRVACKTSSIITLVATTTAGNVAINGVDTLAWKL